MIFHRSTILDLTLGAQFELLILRFLLIGDWGSGIKNQELGEEDIEKDRRGDTDLISYTNPVSRLRGLRYFEKIGMLPMASA
ncbi:hypothetical protein AMR41_23670 [Hapalosiphon sp. MRB220]|nr:hypothetical protein AMR41_23670 [Hapalosiphon sp. MRB220]